MVKQFIKVVQDLEDLYTNDRVLSESLENLPASYVETVMLQWLKFNSRSELNYEIMIHGNLERTITRNLFGDGSNHMVSLTRLGDIIDDAENGYMADEYMDRVGHNNGYDFNDF